MLLEGALRYAVDQQARWVYELMEFMRFPTVGVDPGHNRDLQVCASWLAVHLRLIGLQRVEILSTRLHPMVYAEWMGAPGRPTLLIYGHYDVQPADPIREWKSPPFTPVVRGADLFGRGASDDKGQMFIHIKALEAILRTSGRLPVNVRCLFEGDEETGSGGLLEYLSTHRKQMAADAVLLSDSSMPAPGCPALTISLRGVLSLEIRVRGLAHDLHSGIFGGAVLNPLQALCDLLAGLHDRGGRVALPGFYTRVRRWSPRTRQALRESGPSEAQILGSAGARSGWGEPDFTLYERTIIRPSLSIHGIQGGYQGPGSKAVIPASASAKVSIRLAADQDPHETEHQMRTYLARNAPPQVQVEMKSLAAARPVLVDRSHPVQRVALQALRRGFGADPRLLGSGGTIPAVSAFHHQLGLQVVMMGFALPDDRAHAQNEKLHLPNFNQGIQSSIHFIHLLGSGLQ